MQSSCLWLPCLVPHHCPACRDLLPWDPPNSAPPGHKGFLGVCHTLRRWVEKTFPGASSMPRASFVFFLCLSEMILATTLVYMRGDYCLERWGNCAKHTSPLSGDPYMDQTDCRAQVFQLCPLTPMALCRSLCHP